MKLVVLSETVSPAHGIGNNWGETITKKYKCPCGAGTVTTEIETTTGHKSISTTIDCIDCAKNYHIVNSESRSWSIVPNDLV